MILGTYANLGAIDEHQSGVNIQIDRLPDIHVTHPIDDIHILPSEIEQIKYKADVVSNKPIDTLFEINSKLKIPKRKVIKSNKTKEQPAQIETAREINLIDNVEPEIPAKQIVNVAKLDEKSNDPLKIQSNLNVKSADESKLIIASPGSEPATSPKKKSPNDSLINKDAIQKEEREIEFNANEQRINDVERTQEILDAVKNQLSKQNEANHKIVLQKISEISEKVNRIAQKDEQIVQPSDTSKFDVTKNSLTNKSMTPNKRVNENLNDNSNNQMKMPLSPVPIAKLLVERKVSSVSNQVNEPKIEMQPTPSIVVGPKRAEDIAKEENVPESPKEMPPHRVEETNANVGRDLLSHQTAQINGIETDRRDKTEN